MHGTQYPELAPGELSAQAGAVGAVLALSVTDVRVTRLAT